MSRFSGSMRRRSAAWRYCTGNMTSIIALSVPCCSYLA